MTHSQSETSKTVKNKQKKKMMIKNNNANQFSSQKDYLLYVLYNSVGLPVKVTVTSGDAYEGLLYTATPSKSGGINVVLHYAYKSTEKDNRNSLKEILVIPAHKFVDLTTCDTDIHFASFNKDNFRVDADIGSSNGIVEKERELEKWGGDSFGAEYHMGTQSYDDDLDDDKYSEEQGHWDQFNANKVKFGIEMTYDEELYTTRLDKNAFTEEQMREAERLERSILEQKSKSIHEAEERNQQLPVDYDEESRFGAVVRPGLKGSKASQHAHQNQNRNKEVGALNAVSAGLAAVSTGIDEKVKKEKEENKKEKITSLKKQTKSSTATSKDMNINDANYSYIHASDIDTNNNSHKDIETTTTAGATALVTTQLTTEATITASITSKLNPEAKGFTPNVHAKPFVPRAGVPDASTVVTSFVPVGVGYTPTYPPQTQQQQQFHQQTRGPVSGFNLNSRYSSRNNSNNYVAIYAPIPQAQGYEYGPPVRVGVQHYTPHATPSPPQNHHNNPNYRQPYSSTNVHASHAQPHAYAHGPMGGPYQVQPVVVVQHHLNQHPHQSPRGAPSQTHINVNSYLDPSATPYLNGPPPQMMHSNQQTYPHLYPQQQQQQQQSYHSHSYQTPLYTLSQHQAHPQAHTQTHGHSYSPNYPTSGPSPPQMVYDASIGGYRPR